MAHQVAALAAAANLLTTVVGVYFTLFISLPTTIWLYGKLEPVLGRFARQGRRDRRRRCRGRRDARARLQAGLGDRLTAYAVCGLFALVGNQFGYKVPIRTRCRACSSSWRWWC